MDLNREVKYDVILDCLYNIKFWNAWDSKLVKDVSYTYRTDIIEYGRCFRALESNKRQLPEFYIPVLPIIHKDTEEPKSYARDPIKYLDFHLDEIYPFLDKKRKYFLTDKNEQKSVNIDNDNRFSEANVLDLRYQEAANLEDNFLFEQVSSYYLCKTADEIMSEIYSSGKSKEEYYSILSITKAVIGEFRELPYRYGRTALLSRFIKKLDSDFDDQTIDYYKWIVHTEEKLHSMDDDYQLLRKEFLGYLVNEFLVRNNGKYIEPLYNSLNQYVTEEQYYRNIFSQYNSCPPKDAKDSENNKRFISLQKKCFINMPLPQEQVAYYGLNGELITHMYADQRKSKRVYFEIICKFIIIQPYIISMKRSRLDRGIENGWASVTVKCRG